MKFIFVLTLMLLAQAHANAAMPTIALKINTDAQVGKLISNFTLTGTYTTKNTKLFCQSYTVSLKDGGASEIRKDLTYLPMSDNEFNIPTSLSKRCDSSLDWLSLHFDQDADVIQKMADAVEFFKYDAYNKRVDAFGGLRIYFDNTKPQSLSAKCHIGDEDFATTGIKGPYFRFYCSTINLHTDETAVQEIYLHF